MIMLQNPNVLFLHFEIPYIYIYIKDLLKKWQLPITFDSMSTLL